MIRASRILVLGGGYLGQEFERQGFVVYNKAEWRYNCRPLFDAEISFLRSYDAVVNCIGITDTRACERGDMFQYAMDVNAVLPGRLSMALRNTDTKFIQISSGCLYNTLHATEETPPVAHCRYSLMKWAGELNCCLDDIILRPRLLYSDKIHDRNFLCRLPKFDKCVIDKFDSFTYAPDIPKAVRALVESKASGVFNICSQGFSTVWDIADMLGLRRLTCNIEDVRQETGVNLVNCTMITDKLEQVYKPAHLTNMIDCFEKLQKEGLCAR